MPITKLIKNLIFQIYNPPVKHYLSQTRYYRYRGIKISVQPGVFHPGLFFSTKFLIGFLAQKELTGKQFWELGAGSGLISIFAAKKGAQVTSSDISKTAISNIIANAAKNDVALNPILSDLFQNIPEQMFDYIIINPPYYPKKPVKESQYAWFCGENFEYFYKLFAQLQNYHEANAKVIMVLSEDCEIERIKEIARENGYHMKIALEKTIWWEKNYIFNLNRQMDEH